MGTIITNTSFSSLLIYVTQLTQKYTTAAYRDRRQQIDLIGELYFLRKYLGGQLIFPVHVEQSRKEGEEGALG